MSADDSIVGVLATDESESVVEAQPIFSDGGTSDSYLDYYSTFRVCLCKSFASGCHF